MKITKYGHACLLIETNGVAILTDPGIWNAMPDPKAIDAIVITHEHPDHCEVEKLQALITKHPGVRVITHPAVGSILEKAGIAYEAIEPGNTFDIKGVPIQSIGTEHASIYGGSPCRNTGYVINGELFVPGDALHDIPPAPVRLLALPTGGPWMKLSDAIDYAKKLKPEIVFPVHDGMYIEAYRVGPVLRVATPNLESAGIKFVDMPAGSVQEF